MYKVFDMNTRIRAINRYKALRAEGHADTYARGKTAFEFGTTTTTVRTWIDPTYKAKRMEAVNRRRRNYV